VQRAYEALVKDAATADDDDTPTCDGAAPTSSSSPKAAHASYELRLILETHALLFAQHGRLLRQYRYPSYPLLLSLFRTSGDGSGNDDGSGSGSGGSGGSGGGAAFPVPWLALVARALLATAGGANANPGNARALCVDARGAAAIARVLRRAVRSASAAAASAVATAGDPGSGGGSGSSEGDDDGSALALLPPLLGLLCGPFAGLPDFKAFLEAPAGESAAGGPAAAGAAESSGNRGDDGGGRGCVQDLCKCLRLAAQRPELVTLVLRGLLKLLCLPPSAAAATSTAAATSAAAACALKAGGRGDELGRRLLDCPGFFETLLDFLLRYDLSLPLPRAGQAAAAAAGHAGTAAETAAEIAAETGAGAAAAAEGVSGDSHGPAQPLQLAANHHALLALRVLRSLAAPPRSTAGAPCAAVGVAAAGVAAGLREALQALLPGDLAWRVLALDPKRAAAAGVALLGDPGPRGVDTRAIVAAAVLTTAAGASAARRLDERCIEADEESALAALNTPADTPLVIRGL
jgi:hypothetical protein